MERSFRGQRAKSSAVVACDMRFTEACAMTPLTRHRPRRCKAKPSASAANEMAPHEACPFAFSTRHAFVSLTGNFLACDVFSHVPLLEIVV
jgi:hypothetical protein